MNIKPSKMQHNDILSYVGKNLLMQEACDNSKYTSYLLWVKIYPKISWQVSLSRQSSLHVVADSIRRQLVKVRW